MLHTRVTLKCSYTIPNQVSDIFTKGHFTRSNQGPNPGATCSLHAIRAQEGKVDSTKWAHCIWHTTDHFVSCRICFKKASGFGVNLWWDRKLKIFGVCSNGVMQSCKQGYNLTHWCVLKRQEPKCTMRLISFKVENSKGIHWMKNDLADLLHLTKKEVKAGFWLKCGRKNLPCCFYISANLFLDLPMSIQQLSDGGEEICDSLYWLSYWLPPCNLMISSYT